MLLSPDQKWLAMVCDTPADSVFAVYVYSIAEKKLYELSDFAGFGLCFTGPNRLAYIEPELREGTGEVEAARDGTLPALVTQADIRGVLHTHSIYSDGGATIADMAAGARARGRAAERPRRAVGPEFDDLMIRLRVHLQDE